MTEPRHPALSRLATVPDALRRARLRSALRRAALEAATVQLALLPSLAWIAASRPYGKAWLYAACATWAVWLWPALRLLREALRPGNRPERLAEALDRANPAAPDVFRTARNASVHSPETLDALEALFRNWEPRLVLAPPPGAGAVRRRLVAAALLFAAAVPVFSPTPLEVLRRMALPLRVLNAIPAPRLAPLALPGVLARGDTLLAGVRLEHVPPGRPVYVRIRRRGDGAGEVRYAMRRDASGDRAFFRYGPVQEDFSVRFDAAGAVTGARAVRVVPPPRLRALTVTVEPPAYTRLPREILPGMPGLLGVLPGSRVAWSAEAERALREWSVQVREEGGGISPETTRGSGTRFGFTRVVRRPMDVTLRLRDAGEEGGGETVEGPWRIALKPDAPPEVALLLPVPGADGELPRTFQVPVRFRAADDFGITRVRLRWRLLRADGGNGADGADETGTRAITAWRAGRDGAGEGLWDASALRPRPGDVIELSVEAEDNDAVSGPKSARSGTARLRLPSAEEVRAAIAAREDEAAAGLASALERERRLRRTAEPADKGRSADATQASAPVHPAEEEDIRRVLSDAPRRNLAELRAQLVAETRAAARRTRGAGPEPEAAESPQRERALRELQAAAEILEKRLPGPEVARASVAARREALEALNRDQRELQRRLAETRPPAGERGLEAQRARMESDLSHNIKEQGELQKWLQDRERVETAEAQRLSRAERQAERMEQDVRGALEQMEDALRKAMENGALNADVLEKMDRIRDLLEEVLDEDTKQRVRREADEGSAGVQDMQRAVRELLERQDDLGRDLERAIRMLEALRTLRETREVAAELRALEEAQRELAGELSEDSPAPSPGAEPQAALSAPEAAELARRQEALEKRLDETLRDMERLGREPGSPSARKPVSDDARKARDAMREAREKMGRKKPDRKGAQAEAQRAAQRLRAASMEMEKRLAEMDARAGLAEAHRVLGETLEFSRWLDDGAFPFRNAARPLSGPGPGDFQAAARVARWLSNDMTRLADLRPFEGDALRREAAALAAQADALGTQQASLVAMRGHARAAARELLKWTGMPPEDGGELEGDGQGDSEFGGGDQGMSDREGSEGIARRMQGISGRQMAANRMTQELLRSLMRERQSGGGREGMPSGGAANPSGGNGTGPASPGRESGPAPGNSGEMSGAAGGMREGAGPDGPRGNSGSDGPGAAANAQQRVAADLESLAEAADDGGGAARKLRQLAAEARALEEELRRGRLDPEELRRRQERFQARLLEAAHAMEERGQRQERRAEAYAGGAGVARPPPMASDSLAAELKRRRDRARALPLTPEQRRRVEWYYERLLGP